MGIRKMLTFMGVALFICLLSDCTQGPPATTSEQSKTVAARVETAKSTLLPIYSILPGTVVSADRVEIASRLTGYVQGLEVHEGQAVKQGQLLLTVDPSNVKAEIRRARAELASAKATLKDARANYERYKDLYRHRAATGQQYQQIETNYRVALGSYEAAQAALAGVRAQLKYAEVHAPFTGLVVSKLVDSGQLATPGTPLLIIEDPNHLQVQVQVGQLAFVHLKIGQKIHIQFETSDFKTRTLTGRVERLVAAANPTTHTHLVKIGIPASRGAYSGKYTLVSIPVGEQKGIVVPSEAIYNRAGITGVFVVNGEDLAQFRMVTLGEDLPQGRVILSGLFAGDRVIVSAKEPLANGVKIRVRSEGGA